MATEITENTEERLRLCDLCALCGYQVNRLTVSGRTERGRAPGDPSLRANGVANGVANGDVLYSISSTTRNPRSGCRSSRGAVGVSASSTTFSAGVSALPPKTGALSASSLSGAHHS